MAIRILRRDRAARTIDVECPNARLSARTPLAVVELPVVFLKSAKVPLPVLSPSVVLCRSAWNPLAVLLKPQKAASQL
jgi:hypothetical protein